MKESLLSNILSVFKLMIDNTPLIVAVITISGAIKLFTYYKSFNVLIFPFMDAGEIVLLFASNLIPFLGLVIFIVFTVIFYDLPTLSWLIVLPIALVVSAILLNKYSPQIYFYETVIQIISFLLLYIIVVWLLNVLNSGSVNSDLAGMVLLSGLSVSILFASTLFALNEVYKVKNKKFFAKIEVYIDGAKIENNEYNYYIGNPNNYLFFYHAIDKSTEVIPMSEVDRIVFK